MIIGIDKDSNIISVGIVSDPNAFATKIIPDQRIDIITHNYKYENGKVIDLGLKREFSMTEIEKIDEELKQIDNEGVNRHLENQIEASNTYDTIYESTRKLIDRKNELREQRKLLMGGASSGEDNINK